MLRGRRTQSAAILSTIAATSLILGACSSASKAPAKNTTVKSQQVGPTPIKPGKTKPDADTPPGPSVICKYGSTTREITVVKNEEGCTVTYSKDGTSSEIATGSAASTKCEDVQSTVRGNLEKAGYVCQ